MRRRPKVVLGPCQEEERDSEPQQGRICSTRILLLANAGLRAGQAQLPAELVRPVTAPKARHHRNPYEAELDPSPSRRFVAIESEGGENQKVRRKVQQKAVTKLHPALTVVKKQWNGDRHD